MNIVVLATLVIVCLLFGIFFVSKAIWKLRAGDDQRWFLIHCVIGTSLLFLVWFFVSFPIFGTGTPAAATPLG